MAMLYSIVAGPAEHLLQTMQAHDAHGGILRDLANTSSNLFITCRRAYMEMLIHPLNTSMRVMVSHFEFLGIAAVGLIFQTAMSLILEVDARIWKQLQMKYAAFPFCLVLLILGGPMAVETAKRLHNASPCCLDEMSKKVKALSHDWLSLLNHQGLMTALTIWSWVARICNMGTDKKIKNKNK